MDENKAAILVPIVNTFNSADRGPLETSLAVKQTCSVNVSGERRSEEEGVIAERVKPGDGSCGIAQLGKCFPCLLKITEIAASSLINSSPSDSPKCGQIYRGGKRRTGSNFQNS